MKIHESMKIYESDRYILKSYSTSKNTIDWQYTERGPAAVVSTITSNIKLFCSSTVNFRETY